MNKLVLVGCILATALIGGCKSDSPNCKDNGKPVAPETYQNGSSNKTDPKLPDQKPWWKEAK